METVAADPEHPLSNTQGDRKLRSSHIRHSAGVRTVKNPVHVLFYRTAASVVEIVRVLHERMEPSRHLDDDE
jgi:toxin ParE1/3/4